MKRSKKILLSLTLSFLISPVFADTSNVAQVQQQAMQGDPTAQNDLGDMYRKGQGVAQSDAKAVEWYSKAAAQGYMDAQNNLGVMYDHGRGVAQSNAKANEWFLKAANNGSAQAKLVSAGLQ